MCKIVHLACMRIVSGCHQPLALHFLVSKILQTLPLSYMRVVCPMHMPYLWKFVYPCPGREWWVGKHTYSEIIDGSKCLAKSLRIHSYQLIVLLFPRMTSLAHLYIHIYIYVYYPFAVWQGRFKACQAASSCSLCVLPTLWRRTQLLNFHISI